MPSHLNPRCDLRPPKSDPALLVEKYTQKDLILDFVFLSYMWQKQTDKSKSVCLSPSGVDFYYKNAKKKTLPYDQLGER